jgi:hypothetical protein
MLLSGVLGAAPILAKEGPGDIDPVEVQAFQGYLDWVEDQISTGDISPEVARLLRKGLRTAEQIVVENKWQQSLCQEITQLGQLFSDYKYGRVELSDAELALIDDVGASLLFVQTAYSNKECPWGGIGISYPWWYPLAR